MNEENGKSQETSYSYWHIIYEVSGRPPYLKYGDRPHRKDLGFKAQSGEFPIETARKAIASIYGRNPEFRYNFDVDAITSWIQITENQYAEMDMEGNTVRAKKDLLEKKINAYKAYREKKSNTPMFGWFFRWLMGNGS